MYWLVIAVLVLAIYGALKVHALGKGQLAVATFLEERLKQEPEGAESGLAYGWFDDGWPVKPG
ncbi:MAG: hypothetical protein WKF37_08130 [Bryobacteraceae bacterium]